MRIVRPNRSGIVYDVIDGQVLIIRSDTGAYYSLEGTAAEVWAGLMASGDEGAIVADLQARYPEAFAAIADEVPAFITALLASTLLEEGPMPDGAAETAVVPASAAWATPAMESFNDMADLLLFDPIHEVGPEGWPHAST